MASTRPIAPVITPVAPFPRPNGPSVLTGPFRRLLLSAACFYITIGGAYPLLVLQTKSLEGLDRWERSLAQGSVVGLPLLITVVATILWGRHTDRLGARRPTLLMTMAAGGVLFLPMAWLGAWPLVALRVVQMGFFAAGYVLYASLASQYHPRARATSLGYYNMASGIGWGLGGLMVSFLVPESAYGQASAEVIGAGVFLALAALLAAALLYRLPEPEFQPERGRLRDLFVGPNRRLLLLVALTALLLMAGYNQLIVFFPDYLMDITDNNNYIMGLLFAASGILGSLFSGYIGRFTDRHGRRTGLRLALASYVLAMVFYTLVAYPPVFEILEEVWWLLPALLIGVAWAFPLWIFFMVASSSMISDLSPSHQRGRAMGLLQSAMYLGMGLGALTAGLIKSQYDFWVVFATGTLVVALSALVGFNLPDTQPLAESEA